MKLNYKHSIILMLMLIVVTVSVSADVTDTKITGVSGDGVGKVLCVKSDGFIGTCTDQPGVGGTCTCT